jgi:hypothetical protein
MLSPQFDSGEYAVGNNNCGGGCAMFHRFVRTKDVANSAPKGGGVETGRNRSRDWMCGIKNWVEENEDSERKLKQLS